MKVILTLASNSPRRRELLVFGGWMFNVRPVDIDETPHAYEDSADYVLRMAVTKAQAAGALLNPGGIAVAADTTVVDGKTILGKPANPREAAEMLWQLRGRTHQVHTAIAVLRAGDAAATTDLCTTTVPMRHYSDEEIFAYIQSGDPFDKAGGYAIQNPDFHPVEALTGCYANVVGLPICHLVRTLEKVGITTSAIIPVQCREHLGYDCSFYPEVLGKNP